MSDQPADRGSRSGSDFVHGDVTGVAVPIAGVRFEFGGQSGALVAGNPLGDRSGTRGAASVSSEPACGEAASVELRQEATAPPWPTQSPQTLLRPSRYG